MSDGSRRVVTADAPEPSRAELDDRHGIEKQAQRAEGEAERNVAIAPRAGLPFAGGARVGDGRHGVRHRNGGNAIRHDDGEQQQELQNREGEELLRGLHGGLPVAQAENPPGEEEHQRAG